VFEDLDATDSGEAATSGGEGITSSGESATATDAQNTRPAG
jgi:hypothetical protein